MPLPGPLKVLSVSDLNRQARQLLEGAFGRIMVEGEISNFKHHSSGHMYFSLKDSQAQLPMVMFASANAGLTFRPRDGQHVLAQGRLTLYEVRGQYQLVADNLYPAGEGALWLKFEALRERLRSEGIFEPARKQALPTFPLTVGLITSPTGAAVHDLLNVLRRRSPQVTALLRPTLVQGALAAADIVAAIAEQVAHGAADLLILARGGGSLEDLWPFNEEEVVRAVAACPLPVISAIGHETDMTLCDLAADVRAPTPSAAAELAVPEREGYLQLLDEQTQLLEAHLRRRLAELGRQVRSLENQYVLRQPLRPIEIYRQTARDHQGRLDRAMTHLFHSFRQRTKAAQSLLEAADPQRPLERGYALVSREASGELVARKRELRSGELLQIRFADGTAPARAGELGPGQ